MPFSCSLEETHKTLVPSSTDQIDEKQYILIVTSRMIRNHHDEENKCRHHGLFQYFLLHSLLWLQILLCRYHEHDIFVKSFKLTTTPPHPFQRHPKQEKQHLHFYRTINFDRDTRSDKDAHIPFLMMMRRNDCSSCSSNMKSKHRQKMVTISSNVAKLSTPSMLSCFRLDDTLLPSFSSNFNRKNRWENTVGWIRTCRTMMSSTTMQTKATRATPASTTGHFITTTMLRSTAKEAQSETKQQLQRHQHEKIPNNSQHENQLQLKTQKQSQTGDMLEEYSTMSLSSNYSMKPIETIAIVGGTHGNEYTGVWIIREIEEYVKSKQQQQYRPCDSTTLPFQTLFPSLLSPSSSNMTITALIGNPVAHENNRRFMNVDLNRQFTYQSLLTKEEFDMKKSNDNMEIYRANEINQLLGPKTYQPKSNDDSKQNNMDLVIDLHSTTSAMGCTLIVPEGDIFMIQAAAYVVYKCNQYCSSHNNYNEQVISNDQKQSNQNDYDDDTINQFHPLHMQSNQPFDTRILIDHVRSCHSTRPFLPSIGKHEFTIEVGPVPQGVLRHDAIIKTKIALYYLMEFVSLYNSHYSENAEHPTDKKYHIRTILQEMYPSNIVPCYTDLGKIPWPSHTDNPHFPLYVVHESIQDRDFLQPISIGHPIFITLDGNTIYYDGLYGDTIYLGFINEGGYYYSSSGTGIAAFNNATCSLYSGLLQDS